MRLAAIAVLLLLASCSRGRRDGDQGPGAGGPVLVEDRLPGRGPSGPRPAPAGAPVPEPSTALLVAAGVAAVVVRRRRTRAVGRHVAR